MHKGDNENRIVAVQWPMVLLRGGISALMITVGLLAVSSALVLAQVLPENAIGQITVLDCTLGAFCGGIAGGANGKKRIFSGLLIGAFLFFLLILIGVSIFEVRELGKEGAALCLSCLCGGSLSGLIRFRGSSQKRREERRRPRK